MSKIVKKVSVELTDMAHSADISISRDNDCLVLEQSSEYLYVDLEALKDFFDALNKVASNE
jgi:hypothetical protein